MNLPVNTNTLAPIQSEVRFAETLYKVHSSGKIGTWSVEVTLNHDFTASMLVCSAKVVGGAEVKTPTEYTEGKNIGRSNETTPIMQAVFEAQSKVKKKLDGGYVKEKPEAGATVTNSLGLAKPMLALAFDKVKGWNFPVMVQPKMDGHRCLATIQDEKVFLYSRGGKPIVVNHVMAELQGLYDRGTWDGTTLDGELYCHGEEFENISSLIKRPQEDSKKLSLNIYDIINQDPYRDRFNTLVGIITEQVFPTITLTACHTVSSLENIQKLHDNFTQNGYEGSMIRHGDAPYESDKRSSSLMKKKDVVDSEYLIVGTSEGKPNKRLNTRVGMYVCETADGKRFEVVAPGDAQEKDRHAREGQENVGKLLTVFSFGYTKTGIPKHITDSRIRVDL